MQNQFSVADENRRWIGIGQYFPTQYLNSGCNPNAFLFYWGKTQFVRAARDIEKDEEIAHPYIDNGMSLKGRREALFKTYGFICECSLCKLESNDS